MMTAVDGWHELTANWRALERSAGSLARGSHRVPYLTPCTASTAPASAHHLPLQQESHTIMDSRDSTAEHWHVANGTPGYLFDSDTPDTFATRAEATAYARESARTEAWERNDAASHGPAPDFPRIPLARDERYSVDVRVGHAGPFAVSIDRRHDPYSLPYQWEGWPCTDEHADDELGEWTVNE
jgi:hypothetical protein